MEVCNTYLHHGRNGRRKDYGYSQTDWRVDHLVDMPILHYCGDVERMCDTDAMRPFQKTRVDTVGEGFDKIPNVSYVQDISNLNSKISNVRN